MNMNKIVLQSTITKDDITDKWNDYSDVIDMVNNPSHYTKGELETYEIIKIILDGLEPLSSNNGWLLGSALKYIIRHPHKHDPVEDIEKAIWFLNKYKDRLEDIDENR